MLMNPAALREAPVATAPCPYLLAAGVLRPPALSLLTDDFPDIRQPGVFPLSQPHDGEAFSQLISDIRSSETSGKPC